MIANLFRRGSHWYANVQLESWPRVQQRSLGTTDKRVAQAKLVKIVQEAEKEAAGLLPPLSVREAAQRPFLELVEAFLRDLTARQKSANTIRVYGWVLKKLQAECRWAFLRDVTASSFCDWRAESHLSPETLNDHLQAASRFMRWLRRQRFLLENPLEFVDAVDTRATAREVRRALTAEEVVRFLDASPYPRRLVYALALGTGLRRNEVHRLRWADLSLVEQSPNRAKASTESRCEARPSEGGAASALGSSPPSTALCGSSVRVPACIAKNRRTTLLPLPMGLAAQLREWRKPDDAPFGLVFPHLVPDVSTMKRDLARAGIPFVDELGRRVDFHALRYSFGTHLVLSGAQPRIVMELMRHSDLKLTMKLYTDSRHLLGPASSVVDSFLWDTRMLSDRENTSQNRPPNAISSQCVSGNDSVALRRCAGA